MTTFDPIESQSLVTMTAEPCRTKSLVIGATGLVGGYIVERLRRAGEHPLTLSRSPRNNADATWFQGVMEDMVFDSTPAAQDFGWKPRSFHPVFG